MNIYTITSPSGYVKTLYADSPEDAAAVTFPATVTIIREDGTIRDADRPRKVLARIS